MEGRAAPTLPETFFSLYFTTRYKRNTAARNDNWGIVLGGCVRYKKRNHVLRHILTQVSTEKGPFRRNIPQDSGGGPFLMFEIYDPKLDLTGSS